jgi:ligand-binding sensor domain-containing protein
MVSEQANSLFRDKENNYWISTGNGISIYNEGKQFYKLHRVIVKGKGREADPLKIKALAQTEPENVWLATNLGLYQFNLATGEFKHIIYLQRTRILQRFVWWNHIWIGIYDKLIELDTKTGAIVKPSPTQGYSLFEEMKTIYGLVIGQADYAS